MSFNNFSTTNSNSNYFNGNSIYNVYKNEIQYKINIYIYDRCDLSTCTYRNTTQLWEWSDISWCALYIWCIIYDMVSTSEVDFINLVFPSVNIYLLSSSTYF